ncbi:hypothetical protein [Micromonospora tulbaghiae]|uniref:hypothetical protein n=1 Tax=Micromonospora tulbaghiae TaxID=479978 RepID=UPI000EA32F5A|nr:hypothetical protein [Micromonospora tulbaghiae]
MTPKRTRRAPAAKKAAPVAKKAAPAVKKTARRASSPKPEAPVEPAFTAPEPRAGEREPDGVEPVTAEKPATAPRPGRPVKAEPAAEKASPAKRAKRAAPAAAAPASETTTVSATAPVAPEPAASESEPTAADQAPEAEPAVIEQTPETEPAAVERTPQAEPAAVERAPETEPAVVEQKPGQPGFARTPEKGWRAVGPQLRDHPGFAPELLALAAVDVLGPRARDWVDQVRRAYPEADADGVARLATRRFVRTAGAGGALAAGAGLFAPVAELAAVLWTQANLVLHLAAAYGRDPAHPDRAAELLVLTLVHPDDGTARAALAAARAADSPAEGPWGRVAEAAWRLATPVAAQAGGWLGLRLAARLLPGAAALAAATGGTATAERVAARAVARYRPRRA